MKDKLFLMSLTKHKKGFIWRMKIKSILITCIIGGDALTSLHH